LPVASNKSEYFSLDHADPEVRVDAFPIANVQDLSVREVVGDYRRYRVDVGYEQRPDPNQYLRQQVENYQEKIVYVGYSYSD